MDWSLVLASQDIPAWITEFEKTGWALVVEPQDYERARSAIRQYRLENRHWGWRQTIPWSEATFHWGSLGWCFLLMLVHWSTWNGLDSLTARGEFDSAAAARGEWWRAFTAVLLHFDLAHLLSNVTAGFLLLGLAMARYGAGLGLLAAYVAGAAGNLTGLLLSSSAYHGRGASGMVLGALGLIAVPPFAGWSPKPGASKHLLQTVGASIFLFLLLGVSPRSDMLAHLGGFVAGAFFAVLLNLLPPSTFRNKAFISAVWLVFLTLLALTTSLAWAHR